MTALTADLSLDDDVVYVDGPLQVGKFYHLEDEVILVRGSVTLNYADVTQGNRWRVTRGEDHTTPAVHPSGTGLTLAQEFVSGGTIFRSERVTFDMEGLATEDNPPVPGIRLGEYVVPTDSLVLATVYPATAFETTPPGATLTLYPLVRNTNGLTATALVDASVVSGDPGGPDAQGVKSAVDPEVSMVTTEDTHLGAGLHGRPPQIAVVNGAVDTDDTEVPVTGLLGGLVAPFLIKMEGHDEILNVTAILAGPDRFTVQRAQEGTSAEEYGNENILLAELPALTAGEAYIVFWIAPLSGTLP